MTRSGSSQGGTRQGATIVCDRCGVEMIESDASVSPRGLVVHKDGCPKKHRAAVPLNRKEAA